MKKGFSVEIQSDLTEDEDKEAREFIHRFVLNTLDNNFEFPIKGSGGRRSYIRRNVFGDAFSFTDRRLVFRRISKKLRRFAVVKPDTLVRYDTGEPITFNKRCCYCPTCLGGVRVKWKDRPKMYEYVKVGDIKG